MDSQQLHDHIIKPTLQDMGDNYYSKDAALLLLATAAIESDCGHYIKQIDGPALGIWKMKPDTHKDIWLNCDVLNINNDYREVIAEFQLLGGSQGGFNNMITSPMYACAMARLKYSMDPNPLPKHWDKRSVYDYYKRIYNAPLGSSTYKDFVRAWGRRGLSEVKL